MKKYLLAVALLASGDSALAEGEPDILTRNASDFLASEKLCGYSHEMLKGPLLERLGSGKVDGKKVIAYAYQTETIAKDDPITEGSLARGSWR